MENPIHPNVQLLQQVLMEARARGIDQAELAARAGLKPETLSRAKKRDNIELNTLSRLASVVGMQLALMGSEKKKPVKMASVQRKGGLSDARFGLAWSNPETKEEVLVRKALIQGRFHAILESAAVDGVLFVRNQLKQLIDQGKINDAHSISLGRMIQSIERGFDEVDDHASA